MAVLTFAIEPDEFLGLNAIVGTRQGPADRETANTDADVIGLAQVDLGQRGGRASQEHAAHAGPAAWPAGGATA
jgi:hypothetical protein